MQSTLGGYNLFDYANTHQSLTIDMSKTLYSFPLVTRSQHEIQKNRDLSNLC